jgi:hypothetical protein
MDREGNALMIARGFKSVIWVATVGSAALGCYMVSLRVATERNELAKVERQIISAKRDIRSLQTELGTRGRMTQLEQWNAEVLALSAPSSAQFLKDEFTLARLYRNDPTVAERSAEVRLASAEVAPAKPAGTTKPAPPAVLHAVAEPAAPQAPVIHQASFTTAEATAKPKPSTPKADKPATIRTASAATAKPVAQTPDPAAKPAKPVVQRTASAAPANPETLRAGSKAKPTTKPSIASAKPAAKPGAAPAKPVREAAAAPREAKGKGDGGN